MVTRALDYIGDILKHIKPSLVSKNQEGLQLAYWAVGKHKAHILQTHYPIDEASGVLCLFLFSGVEVTSFDDCLCFVMFDSGCIVKHWSPLLATSKAQQLLFRIVDGLLLPHNLTQQDKALRDSLPLYLQVGTNTYTRMTNTDLGQSGHFRPKGVWGFEEA